MSCAIKHRLISQHFFGGCGGVGFNFVIKEPLGQIFARKGDLVIAFGAGGFSLEQGLAGLVEDGQAHFVVFWQVKTDGGGVGEGIGGGEDDPEMMII